MTELWVARCGQIAYRDAREAQGRLEAARQRDEIPDLLLLLEHPPVYTRGRRSEASELPMGVEWYETQGIEVCDTDRGGRVTYHGPGQLVGYPIVDLKPYGGDVHAYVRLLEEAMVAALGDHGVGTGVVDGLTGVWTAHREAPPPDSTAESVAPAVVEGRLRKIGSIGIHVSRGVTTHGLAVNVNNDLQPFEWIVPCGIDGCRMTSLSRELGSEQDIDAFAATVKSRFANLSRREAVELDPSELSGRVAGTETLAGSPAAGALP